MSYIRENYLNSVSGVNSTTSILLADEVFIGEPIDVLRFSTIEINIKSDVTSATDGIKLYFGPDGINWDYIVTDSYTTANQGFNNSFSIKGRYFKLEYTNGSSEQTYFRLQTKLSNTNSINITSSGGSNDDLLTTNNNLLSGINSNINNSNTTNNNLLSGINSNINNSNTINNNLLSGINSNINNSNTINNNLLSTNNNLLSGINSNINNSNITNNNLLSTNNNLLSGINSNINNSNTTNNNLLTTNNNLLSGINSNINNSNTTNNNLLTTNNNLLSGINSNINNSNTTNNNLLSGINSNINNSNIINNNLLTTNNNLLTTNNNLLSGINSNINNSNTTNNNLLSTNNNLLSGINSNINNSNTTNNNLLSTNNNLLSGINSNINNSNTTNNNLLTINNNLLSGINSNINNSNTTNNNLLTSNNNLLTINNNLLSGINSNINNSNSNTNVLTNIGFKDTLTDAFARLRVSQPYTLFENNNVYKKKELLMDEKIIGNASVNYLINESSINFSVSTAGDKITRQSHINIKYQPGKSLLILATGILNLDSNNGENVETRIGYFNDNNGIYFSNKNGVNYIVKRSFVTGSIVETRISQSQWNYDTMDGTGTSGITLDTSKTLIFYIDIEWLGVGSVRTGVIINGNIYYLHIFHHSNLNTTTYISTANLPVRYEIEADSTGANFSGSMKEICCSVLSEGGYEIQGMPHTISNNDFYILDNSYEEYPILVIRLKSQFAKTFITLNNVNIININKGDTKYKVRQYHNVSDLTTLFSGTTTFTSVNDYSYVEYSVPSTFVSNNPNIVKNITHITGFVNNIQGSSINTSLNNVYLSSNIDDVSDLIVLTCIPIGVNNQRVLGSISWSEYL
jgi:hypothetical protein